MKMKLSPLIPAASGKINGHSISNTRNGIVMKTIKQPRRQASHLQSVQRFVTADITNKWQFLTPVQHTAWNNTAINYPYIDNLGEPATRNGFQTFCFLNQNRHILELPILEDPPIYEPILKPFIFRYASPDDQIILKGLNLKNNYLYVVYVQIHYSVGASNHQQTPLIVKTLTPAQLTAGYNLVPPIKQTYATGTRVFRVNIETVAIDTISGNRDLSPGQLVYTVPSNSLGLDVLSYYPFDENADDYFNINNPTYNGGLLINTGIVKGAMSFDGNANSYLNLGNDASLNFLEAGEVGPYTIAFWVKAPRQNDKFIFHKVSPVLPALNGGLILRVLTITSFYETYSSLFSQFRRVNVNNNFHPDRYVFMALVYDGVSAQHVFVDTAFQGAVTTSSGYTRQFPNAKDFIVGGRLGPQTHNLIGEISELTFIKSALTEEQLNTIRTANENGLTILDIM